MHSFAFFNCVFRHSPVILSSFQQIYFSFCYYSVLPYTMSVFYLLAAFFVIFVVHFFKKFFYNFFLLWFLLVVAAINDVCCVCGYLSRCCSSLFTTSISYLKTIMYVICVPTSLFDILMIRFSPSDRMHLNACSIAQMRIIAVGRNRVFLFGNTPIFRSSSIQCHFFLSLFQI